MAAVRAAPTMPPAGPLRIASLPWKLPGLRQPAGGLHEEQPDWLLAGRWTRRAFGALRSDGAQLARHLLHVAAQDGREIGVHHRRVAARHDARQRRRLVRERDLGEARLARQLADALLVRRVRPGVHQHDGDGADARRMRLPQRRAGAVLVQRLDLRPVRGDAPADLGHALVQQVGQAHMEVEQARPGLVADAQQVAEAAVHQQQHPLARGAPAGRWWRRWCPSSPPRSCRAGSGRRAEGRGRRGCRPPRRRGNGRVLGQQLGGGEPPGRVARDDVGEGAAAVDPELPRAARRHRAPQST